MGQISIRKSIIVSKKISSKHYLVPDHKFEKILKHMSLLLCYIDNKLSKIHNKQVWSMSTLGNKTTHKRAKVGIGRNNITLTPSIMIPCKVYKILHFTGMYIIHVQISFNFLIKKFIFMTCFLTISLLSNEN